MASQIRKLLEVKNTTGLSGSSIYRMAKSGTFPKPIKLGVRSSGWIASEVDQWLDDRIAASRNGEA
ncbi:MAG: AlpA family transcriptional regulator [Methylophaga sp.]|nr:AlpA family transcriptional regulator [Methylophaga sp.]